MTTLKVAFAAETILYAPVHVALQRLVASVPYEVVITHGDSEAYQALQDCDLCVCDPVVCAKDAILNRSARQKTRGVVVGSVLTRSGLWTISTQDYRGAVPSKALALADYTLSRTDPLGRTLTYDEGSTGGKTLEYLRKIRQDDGKPCAVPAQPVSDLGAELHYLFDQDARDKYTEPVDTILTCDIMGLIAVEGGFVKPLKADYSPRRLLPFHRDGVLGSQLFTAVIASRSSLGVPEKRRRIQLVLNEIQRELDRLHGSEQEKHSVALDWCNAQDSYRLEAPPYSLREATRRSLSELALHELLRTDVFARTVPVTRHHWRSALTVWGLWSGPVRPRPWEVFGATDLFKECVDNTCARAAAPWRRHAWSFLQRMTSATETKVGYVVSFAYFVYMMSKAPAAFAWIREPESLSALVAVVVFAALGARRAARH